MTAAVRTPHVQDTPGWIEARRDVIGSSDLAVLTGNSPYRSSLLDLFAYKTRLLEAEPPDPETQELFDLGHALEEVIAQRYRVHPKGRPVRRHRHLIIHPEIPWAAASLDRVSAVAGERRIVEVKWVPYRRWDGPEDVPAHVQDQVQWQMFVTGWDVADVAVLLGAHVEVHEVRRDEGYIGDLYAIASWFHGLIDRGELPPVDGSDLTARTLRRLTPRDDGTMLDPVPLELHALVSAWRAAETERDAALDALGKAKNAVRLLLGEHAGARTDGWTLSYRKPSDYTQTKWQLVADAYRRLLEEGGTDAATLDALVGLHSQTVEPERRLNIYWRNAPEGSWT
jgi:putative phage-type endonuclease